MKTYNKLVRDKTIDIIKADGRQCQYRILNDDKEFILALADKLIEEAKEVKEAILEGNLEHVIEEMADLKEVTRSMLINIGRGGEVLKKATEKNKERGGFEYRVFLIEADEPK